MKSKFLTVKDHSVSQESFDLIFNPERDVLKTEPQPSPESLGSYYESDDYISHTNSARSFFERAYHVVRNITLKQKLALILKYKSPGSLLDIGAGTGVFVDFASKNGWQASGTEPNEKARQIAVTRDVEIHSSSSIFSSKFDVITMWHVLEHVPDLDQQIEELKRLLKANGILLIAVPNFNSFDAAHYKENWAAYDVPRHLWHFSKAGIQRIFKEKGMEVINIEPMKFDAFYVSLLSEKIATGKINYFKAIVNGFRSNLHGKKSGEYSSHIYIIANKEYR